MSAYTENKVNIAKGPLCYVVLRYCKKVYYTLESNDAVKNESPEKNYYTDLAKIKKKKEIFVIISASLSNAQGSRPFVFYRWLFGL